MNHVIENYIVAAIANRNALDRGDRRAALKTGELRFRLAEEIRSMDKNIIEHAMNNISSDAALELALDVVDIVPDCAISLVKEIARRGDRLGHSARMVLDFNPKFNPD